MIAIPIPDKWIRKMVSEAITAFDPAIPVFDSRTNGEFPATYVLMSTQNSTVDPASKCGDRWIHFLQLDCIVRYPAVGNPGSRLDADDLAETVRQALQTMTLDPASGLNLLRYQLESPFDSVIDDENIITTQKTLRLECILN